MAAALYRSAAALADGVDPASVWDLYCGVGGFGLHLAGPAGSGAGARSVLGVEVSEQAIESARLSAAERGIASTWIAADATSWITEQPPASRPDLVVVNPPRRGIGTTLAGWLEDSGVPHVLYSSCNVDSLARDLAAMPSLRPVSAQLLDMFPHTGHHEVLTLLSR